MVFTVTYDPSHPGTCQYTRRTAPAIGYGDGGRRSDHQRSTVAVHPASIRDFLAMGDPVTGHLEDDPDDDGPDIAGE